MTVRDLLFITCIMIGVAPANAETWSSAHPIWRWQILDHWLVSLNHVTLSEGPPRAACFVRYAKEIEGEWHGSFVIETDRQTIHLVLHAPDPNRWNGSALKVKSLGFPLPAGVTLNSNDHAVLTNGKNILFRSVETEITDKDQIKRILSLIAPEQSAIKLTVPLEVGSGSVIVTGEMPRQIVTELGLCLDRAVAYNN